MTTIQSHTTMMAELRRYLGMMRDVRSHCGQPRNWKFACIESLLLKEGREFPAASAPSPVVRIPRACFAQAYQIATKRNSEWLYCEGYAVSRTVGLAVHHAWLTPRDNPGEAYEVAWPDKFTDCTYLGLAFDPAFVRKMFIASRRREYSVLDAWWQHYPLLSGVVPLESVTIR